MDRVPGGRATATLGAMPDRPRILLVEDEPDISRLLARYLGRSYDVETAADGEAGLAILLRPPPPQLVISDVMMPKMNGFKMVEKMRDALTTGRPPVIFLTARDQPADLVHGIQAGARHYLMKPVQFDDLDKKVKKLLGQ
jgi:DNA-binding response OmpR family regulator